MRTVILLMLLLVVLSSGSCKKDKKPAPVIQITGFALVDNFGNYIGQVGDDRDDWQLHTSLSAKEMALFDFNTNYTLDNTLESTQIDFEPYPNPFANTQSYSARSTDSVLIKVVVVNEYLDVLLRSSIKGKTAMNFVFDYSDRSKFPNKSSMRVYYSFSAKDKPNFKMGYGDIKVCDDTDYMKCF